MSSGDVIETSRKVEGHVRGSFECYKGRYHTLNRRGKVESNLVVWPARVSLLQSPLFALSLKKEVERVRLLPL